MIFASANPTLMARKLLRFVLVEKASVERRCNVPKFLIEVDHPEDTYGCAQAIKLFLESGSHFLANADFGCEDNIHKAWFALEADSREEAIMVVPPQYRRGARVIQLCRFSIPEINEILRLHRPKTA